MRNFSFFEVSKSNMGRLKITVDILHRMKDIDNCIVSGINILRRFGWVLSGLFPVLAGIPKSRLAFGKE